MRKTVMTAVCVAALGLTAGAFAQTADTGNAGAKDAPKATPAKEAASQSAKRLTIEDLGRMLEGMGYEPKARKNDKGEVTGYDFKAESPNWNIPAYVHLSSDGVNVWFISRIDDNVDPGVGAEVLIAALEVNQKIWPAYLAYFPKTKVVRLAYPMPNANVTPATLRKGIDEYLASTSDALDAWTKAKKAKEQAGKTAPAPMP